MARPWKTKSVDLLEDKVKIALKKVFTEHWLNVRRVAKTAAIIAGMSAIQAAGHAKGMLRRRVQQRLAELRFQKA